MVDMNEMSGRRLTICCDDCSMRRTPACADCVVTFVLRDDALPDRHDDLVLDDDQARVVSLLGRAGLVPTLRFEAAG